MQSPSSLPDVASHFEHRLAWLTRLLGIGVLALVAVTWKLWTPQDVFPRVPLFRWAPPDWWDWTSLALFAIGGLGLSIGPSRATRSFATTLAMGFAIAFLCDQHRLQPWAWQFFILALLIALADKPVQWHGWQWLTISIYFYSALSKFDTDFYIYASAQLEHFVGGRLFPGGIPAWDLSYRSIWLWLARSCPVLELLLAALLVWPRSRGIGVVLAAGMHMLLIIVLGPAGLRHSYGVLTWNCWFLFQTAGLFGEQWSLRFFSPRGDAASSRSAAISVESHRPFRRDLGQRCARAILAVVLIWPATVVWGLCDPWIGWAVYVPRRDDVSIRVANDLMPSATNESNQGKFTEVDIGQWSLGALAVPEYPHIRHGFAAALDLAVRTQSDRIEVTILPSQSRRTPRWALLAGSKLNGVCEIRDYCSRFWFNAYPTSMYRRAAREKAMNDDG